MFFEDSSTCSLKTVYRYFTAEIKESVKIQNSRNSNPGYLDYKVLLPTTEERHLISLFIHNSNNNLLQILY
jgi:hypothetical protein